MELQLGVIEASFADMIWDKEPIKTSDLVKLAQIRFDWKRTTTYTVLKRLCEKGLFQNQKGTVTSLVTREEFYALQSQKYVKDRFQGSLPAFIAAFTQDQRLTAEEADEIRRMIDSATE